MQSIFSFFKHVHFCNPFHDQVSTFEEKEEENAKKKYNFCFTRLCRLYAIGKHFTHAINSQNLVHFSCFK